MTLVLMYCMGVKFPVEIAFCGLVYLKQLSVTQTSFFVKLNWHSRNNELDIFIVKHLCCQVIIDSFLEIDTILL